MDPQAVDDLLEQEERKALEKQAAAQAAKRTPSFTATAIREGGPPPSARKRRNTSSDEDAPPSRDPRRQGRSSIDDKYSADREENNDRRTRRMLDKDGDVKMEDHSDRERPSSSGNWSANGSVRSSRDYGRRRRSRSPALGGYRLSPSTDRRDPRYRERQERKRDRERRRSSDHGGAPGDYWTPEGGSRHLPSRDDDVRGGGYRSREGADRGHRAYSPRRSDRGERRRSPPPPLDDRRDRGKPRSPAPTDDERDRRTVFVQQLAARLRTKELRAFFEQVGSVVDAQIVKDRVSGRSKGVGYVEFRNEDSVQKAIQLTGQKLLNIPIIAQLTEAEKNRQARVPKDGSDGPTATQSNGVPFHRLYVGNIHFSITEEDLRQVFEPFGELEFVQLQKEGMEGMPHGPGNMNPGSHFGGGHGGGLGRSKGYGFVQFVDPTQAKEALEKMNGFELAGRPIRVGLGNDKFTPESTQSLLNKFSGQQARDHGQQTGSSFSGMGGRGSHAGGTGNFDRASGREVQEKQGGGASALDDTDVAGVNFSNYSRDALMRKLARVDEPSEASKNEAKAAAVPVKKAKPEEKVVATRCVLLKNMYNQAEETEPGWQKELEEDVKIECEEKYGHVVHVGLALDNNDGEIYIKFDRVQGGENAIRGLNGRYFGGRMITAQYVVDAVYHMNFPKAANV